MIGKEKKEFYVGSVTKDSKRIRSETSMEKNRMRPVKVGNGVRMSFAHQQEVLEMPNLIEVQTDSYKWFLDDGLIEVFRDFSPIADFGGHLSLEFVDFELCSIEI